MALNEFTKEKNARNLFDRLQTMKHRYTDTIVGESRSYSQWVCIGIFFSDQIKVKYAIGMHCAQQHEIHFQIDFQLKTIFSSTDFSKTHSNHSIFNISIR